MAPGCPERQPPSRTPLEADELHVLDVPAGEERSQRKSHALDAARGTDDQRSVETEEHDTDGGARTSRASLPRTPRDKNLSAGRAAPEWKALRSPQ